MVVGVVRQPALLPQQVSRAVDQPAMRGGARGLIIKRHNQQVVWCANRAYTGGKLIRRSTDAACSPA